MNDYTFKDNSKQVLLALEQAIEDALFAVGAKAETHAKALTPVDTGKLRNSITFALSGKEAHIKSYSGDNGEEGGEYKGVAPNDNKKAVYIGSNVNYAIYRELGTSKSGGAHMLQRAATEHGDEYKTIFKDIMKNAK